MVYDTLNGCIGVLGVKCVRVCFPLGDPSKTIMNTRPSCQRIIYRVTSCSGSRNDSDHRYDVCMTMCCSTELNATINGPNVQCVVPYLKIILILVALAN